MKKNQSIDGIFLLDKPIGLSSNAALQTVKRLFAAKKAGHTGSLDPLATGMLPICFGQATKFAGQLLDADKYYRVHAVLGAVSDTGDAEGQITYQQSADAITKVKLKTVCQQFRGAINQVPPMHSALKHQGQPLYKLARRGISIKRDARQVIIHDLSIIGFNGHTLLLDVHCSKGTYIRTLVEDIGKALGCGAYVAKLRRLSVSPFIGEAMYSLRQLELSIEAGFIPEAWLLPVDHAIIHLPTLTLTSEQVTSLLQGQSLQWFEAMTHENYRLYSEKGCFLGIGQAVCERELKPKRLMANSAQ